jgi:hypothetical protein
MRKLWLFIASIGFLCSSLCMAETQLPPLNLVRLQLNNEAWVNTSNAKVLIAMDATLNQAELANIHSQILSNLQKISKADWHIIQFNRSKDQSNLERLQVLAEARIGGAGLAQVAKRVEVVTKPGAAYRIASIEFTPSLADMEKTRTQLRDQLYSQIKTEIASLDKTYSNSHYFVHEIIFRENSAPAVNRNKMMLLAMDASVPAENQALQIGNQLQLVAEVTLASKLNIGNNEQK